IVEISKERYIKLKNTLKRLLEPIEDLDFSVVIEMTTDTKFKKITKSRRDKELLDTIRESADLLMNQIYENPRFGNRPNDVSQPLEKVLRNYLEEEGLEIVPPKGFGYPDMILKDKYGRITYLEVKVSRIENIRKASARNFFYKISKNTRVIYDGRHLLLGFAIEEDSREVRHWRTVFWKLVDLYKLKVNLKPEFNADNTEIYSPKNIIAKNAISSSYKKLM
ncbi:unnamed protein product, partial [marine sediment metagenome]